MRQVRFKRKNLLTAICAVVAIIMLCFVFTGCGSARRDLVGQWYLIGFYDRYDDFFSQSGTSFGFLEDGTGTFNNVLPITWSVSSRVLSISYGTEDKVSYDFRMQYQRLYMIRQGTNTTMVHSRCPYDLPSNIAAALVGTWELYDTNRPGTVSDRVEFARNGSGNMRHGAIMENFTWSVEGRELIIEQAGGHLTIVYNITELTQNRLSYEADFPGTGLLRVTYTRQ